MDQALQTILIQAACYGMSMLLVVFIYSFLLRGFIWKYFKVKKSFGKLVMIKARNKLRDEYIVGWVADGCLKYKAKTDSGKKVFMYHLPDTKVIYRSMGINWVDVDTDKNAICNADYSVVSGFDTEKFSDLLTRAMMRPSISSSQEKIILIILCIVVIGILALIYISWSNYDKINELSRIVGSLIVNSKGTIVYNASVI